MVDKIKLVCIIAIVLIGITACAKSTLMIDDELLIKSTVIGTDIQNGHEYSEYYKNGYDSYINGDYIMATSNLEKAIDLYEYENDKHNELGDIQYFLARTYYLLGEYNMSLNLSEQSIELNGKSHNTYLMNCINLADNYYKLGNYENALKYYAIAEKAYDKTSENGYYDVTEVLTAIFKVYEETGNTDMLLEYAQKIENYEGVAINKENYNNNIMYVYDIMANTYTQIGEYEKAIQICEKIKNISIKKQDYNYAALILGYEAELYFEIDNDEKAVLVIEEGIALCDEQLQIQQNAELTDAKNILESKLM